MGKIRFFEALFEGMYPVGSHCFIAAYTKEQALAIALETITHKQPEDDPITVEEIDVSEPGLISYDSGDY